MGKLPAAQPLRSKRKAQQVSVRTPSRDAHVSEAHMPDLQSSYFSICYLLQSENEISVKLVNENNVLSQILEKLSNGCPKDVEQLSLSALASALSWAPSEVLSPLLQQGLLDYCLGVLQRSSSRGATDPIGDASLELLRDLVYLDDRVAQWVLDQMEVVLTLLSSSNHCLKRGCGRLIYALVEVSPGAFVPGLPESRLTKESMQLIFSQFGSADVETCCFITMSGLLLESLYGSSVVPAVANMRIDISKLIGDLLIESGSFAVAPSEEQEFRMNLFRSHLRGVSSLMEMLADGISEQVDEKIASVDSIEERRFFVGKTTPDNTLVEHQVIIGSQILAIDSAVVSSGLGVLTSQLLSESEVDDEECGVVSNKPVSDRSLAAAATVPPTLLLDQDVSNVFELVSHWVRIDRLYRFRFGIEGSPLGCMHNFACGILNLDSVDLAVGDMLIGECIEWVQTWLMRAVVRRDVAADEAMVVPVLTGVGRVMVEISSCEERVVEPCIEVIQLAFVLSGRQETQIKGRCAELLVMYLRKLSEKIHGNQAISDELVTSISAAIECVFVVFGEKDVDGVLVGWDWSGLLNRMGQLLHASVKNGPKTQKNQRSEYLLGTVENIAAFLSYKGVVSRVSCSQ